MIRSIISMRELTVDNPYQIIIFCSQEDEAFVADVPELPGCMAHGASHEEALRNADEAISLWLDAAREDGRVIPEPRRLVSERRASRPFGLAKSEFAVPDDFDEPLPEDVLDLFEGK